MKLLLDEMWPAGVADQPRRRGHDVLAIVERADLRGQPDTAVFAAAHAERRAIVTENVADFRPLAADELQRGGSHAGLIFTSNRSFPRHDPRTPGRLVVALNGLLVTQADAADRECWLAYRAGAFKRYADGLMSARDLDAPAVVCDLKMMDRNLAAMAARCRAGERQGEGDQERGAPNA